MTRGRSARYEGKETRERRKYGSMGSYITGEGGKRV